ncbi:septum site-determining protein MinC [Alkalilimnicola sp. S0819]|uniref:septum site-determining protein MinC n=1 Tax=Alkalilimnicola sp. S0819 TaxID=2613922 RepID=UPI001261E764|nr:septum site-determining protein MinC [Alkalilimnicola sp. S0819]KAB7622556.1 septum site-determining protein MinC [Alkalilimnicola sp. S0819]MPQ17443.1 septum site-determining protein MinC [Alkalilimnicola sp. S0819]
MAASPHANAAQPAFELKGRMLTVSVLRVLQAELEPLLVQLDEKLATAPGFFRGLPVILDLEAAMPAEALGKLLTALRQRELVPMGVRGGNPAVEAAAREAGVGIFPRLDGAAAPRAPEPAAAPAPAEQPGAAMVVAQPVRSGQQVYAKGRDLVVLAPVQAGAEVLADGHIHVYGPLRGRALAGVRGDTTARIFCQSLEAELVSVAGSYQISEHISEQERGRAVQISLHGEELRIQALQG